MSDIQLKIQINDTGTSSNTTLDYSGDIEHLAAVQEAFSSMLTNDKTTSNKHNLYHIQPLIASNGITDDDNLFDSIANGKIPVCVGDVIGCTLNNGTVVHFDVVAEDDESFRLDMQELLDYVTYDNIDDYYNSHMMALLPESLKNVMISTTRKIPTANGVKEKMSYLFLPAASEVFSKEICEKVNYVDTGIYEQLDFYKLPRNRVKHLVNPDEDNNGYSDWYWLSSPRSGNSTNVAAVDTNGYATYHSATYTSIAAPVCFRIRRS